VRALRIYVLFFTVVPLLAIPGRAQSIDEQQIRSAEETLASAEGRNDSGPYKRILADDWLAITPDGRVLKRDEIVQNISEHQGEVRPYAVKLSELRVDLFGDTAVVTFVREYYGRTGEAKGKVARESVVNVFTRVAGQWKSHYEKAMPLGQTAS
jgi:ketosteroid isomerase-like protein